MAANLTPSAAKPDEKAFSRGVAIGMLLVFAKDNPKYRTELNQALNHLNEPELLVLAEFLENLQVETEAAKLPPVGPIQ